MTQPLVSVVTPFYNTAPYLAECIESVLAQSYRQFEYLLVNNFSTDGSRDIAARYAALDSRLRLVDNPSFVGQVENYNGALARISPSSTYVKMVQADDAIYPECLSLMVASAERDRRIGLVSAYRRKGTELAGTDLPAELTYVPGREACRRMLRGGCYLLGSPTTLLYRADVVRARDPFYALGHYFEDTEAGYEILLEHDLGFVHETLSFTRVDNISIMSSTQAFNPADLSYLIMLHRYGDRVLPAGELSVLRNRSERGYYRFLGRAALRLEGRRFWKYHRKGLATIGRTVDWQRVAIEAALEPFRLARRPRQLLSRAVTDVRRRAFGRGSSSAPPS
jgi:glycosyltransferase involved in cell wall biosynthesis